MEREEERATGGVSSHVVTTCNIHLCQRDGEILYLWPSRIPMVRSPRNLSLPILPRFLNTQDLSPLSALNPDKISLCPLSMTMSATTKCPDFQVTLPTYTLSPCESAFISMILKSYCMSESPGRFGKSTDCCAWISFWFHSHGVRPENGNF